MPKAKVNSIELFYDTFGDPSSQPLLLIMGLGSQMIRWVPELCEEFGKKGFFVIRFDNRDVGLSTKIKEAGVPDIMKVYQKVLRGETIDASYTLNDMADDAIGLLDFLKIDKAHICGASMGGMIAQTIAIRHPSRVLSLTSIMSSTGNPDLPQPKPEALKVLLTPAPTEREANINISVKAWRILWGSGYPFDEELQRKMAAESYDRSYYPDGFKRQLLGILASGDRTSALASVNVPTLVIHGADDPLVPIEGGKATAKAIPGAKLLIIEGMGHSLPPGTWSRVVDAITENASLKS
ncbi:MAG: alpha/beta fold hydrolase [Candidatus Thorarchaeota archaeon]